MMFLYALIGGLAGGVALGMGTKKAEMGILGMFLGVVVGAILFKILEP